MKIEIKVGTFKLQNLDKLLRVTEGQTNSKGDLLKGVGEDAAPELIIARYDKIAGYITGKDGAKVKTGCFYDFKNRKPFEEPKVIYIFRIDGSIVELPADEEPSMEVKAKIKKDSTKKETKKTK